MSKQQNYSAFLREKSHSAKGVGFRPHWRPSFLYDFQLSLVEWSINQGRAAIFADCGLGKTPMALVWAQNVVEETNRPILVLTPLAVGRQFEEEAKKFSVEACLVRDGNAKPGVNITNYEKLHLFSPSDFAGVVCDESSILKSFDGATRSNVIEFLKRIPYRLLTTATAAPNDTSELGNSAEALGEMGYMDMLNKFFVNDQRTSDPRRGWTGGDKWRFKGHAEGPFWQWVASWARACRKPSDLGFDDTDFILPPLQERKLEVKARRPPSGLLFDLPAVGLSEERNLLRRTIEERCEAVAEKVNGNDAAVVWCHLNSEGDFLEKIIPGAKQVKGADKDERKEEIFKAFRSGELPILITKPKIGAWGLNWEHCHKLTYFPSHSYEQYYQAVRRCWRFGQKHPVDVDIICTEADSRVFANLRRKSVAADQMFTRLVESMARGQKITMNYDGQQPVEMPSWM